MQIGCCLASAQFRFSTVFQSGMVLQSGAPIEVWGWGPAGWASALTLSLGEDSANVSLTATSNGTLWQARFEARTATASPLLLSLRDRDNATAQPLAQLSDVLIGMVLLVSGQSNVGISVGPPKTLKPFSCVMSDRLLKYLGVQVSYSNQDDPAAEAENEAAADRLGTTVRLRAVAFADGDTPALELPDAPDCSLPSAQCGCLAWTRSNRSNVVGFSALGWYLARLAVEQLTAAGKVPVVGVIQSDVPGTPIQLWSRRETIKECTNATTYGPDNATTSRHYNAMIYPLIGAKIAVSAVVWYQVCNPSPNWAVHVRMNSPHAMPRSEHSVFVDSDARVGRIQRWRSRGDGRGRILPLCTPRHDHRLERIVSQGVGRTSPVLCC